MFSYSIIGLGKLGAGIAAAIASRGFYVIGVDIEQQTVNAINDGKSPVQETGLGELISANHDRIRATSCYREAILNSDITFIVVPTPADDSGEFNLDYAKKAFSEIGKVLREKNSYHLVGLISTVLPETTRKSLMPILEQQSHKRCGFDFGLCYTPTFLALGSVIQDFLHPDFTLIGEFDSRSGRMLEKAYADIMPGRPSSQRMSLENAELTKISINTYVTMKITFANILADICERIPGGDVDIVSNAVGLDRRIGSKYLIGSIGYGGPCFPRDNKAFCYMAETLGTRAELAETTNRINNDLTTALMKRIGVFVRPGTTVAILGLAYKPGSSVIDNSQGICLAKKLSTYGATVFTHDSLAASAAAVEFKGYEIEIKSLKDCLKQATVVIIATADPNYSKLEAKDLMAVGKPVTIIDFWRILNKNQLEQSNIVYVPIGRYMKDNNELVYPN